ncbi:hypothetical protein [Bradyrhizobium diazoefficiens]
MPEQENRRSVPADAELPTPAKQKLVAPPAGAVWISARQVLARYGGRSEMWLNRKLYGDKKTKPDPDFPKPAYSGRLRFFRLDELEQYDKKIVVRGRAMAET